MSKTKKDIYTDYLNIVVESLYLLRDGIMKKDIEKIHLAKEALATFETCIKYGGIIVKELENLDKKHPSNNRKIKK